jgi:uncharacterized membrane protein
MNKYTKFKFNKKCTIYFGLSIFLMVLLLASRAIQCSRTVLVYLFIRFARISYRRFIAIRYKFKSSTYIQEPLTIDRRGCVHRRDLNEKTVGSR